MQRMDDTRHRYVQDEAIVDNNDKQQLQDLKRSVDLPALLTGYGIDLKKQGASYVALCIWHDEKRPSMGVFLGDDGIWRCNCHSCGQRGTAIDVVQEMDGVDLAEAIQRLKRNHFVRDEKRIKAEAPIVAAKWKHQKPPGGMEDFTLPGLTYVAHWTYLDTDGSLLGYVARYTDANGNKEYRPWTYGTMSANIKPAWKAKAFSSPRPLYGLHKLTSDKRIVLCEGEKATDDGQVLLPGMIAIGWPGGANAIAHIDWSPLAGRNVLLVPDADLAGEKAMYDAARYLLAIGCTVRWLDTSDKMHVKNGWDFADARTEGWTTDDVKTFCEDRITTLTSREIEARQQRELEEKKTVEIATASIPDDMPPSATLIEGEPVRVEEIHDADDAPPNVVPIRPHTQIKETSDFNPLDPAQFFSHSNLASLWVEKNPDWVFCNTWGKWLQWDGSRWKIDERKSINWAVTQEMKAAGTWVQSMSLSVKDRRALANIANITSVMSAASCIPSVVRIGEDFDTNIMLLGTPEGTVDLTTGELREPQREDMITKQTLVAPKRGPHPTWDKVVARATKNCPETKAYFQRWWGYMLTGSCKEESMLMCVGAGASGKTKYLLVADILGEYMVDMDIGLLMESKTERHSSELASLEGARIIRTTEPEEGSRFNESILKRLTGRERISARRLYSECHTFVMQGKIIMGSNFRPSLKSTGEEIRRRIHFVDFPETIPESERDYDLDKKLEAEYPAILQWMIDGCMEWQRMGLAKPESVRKATGAYLDEEDTLAHWIEEKCTTGPACKMMSGEAYQSYAAYIQLHGEGVVSQKRFSQRMESRGYGKKKDGKGRRWITGIEIAPEPIASSWIVELDDKDF